MNENNHDLGFQELAEKYPDFPQLLIRKLDTEVRGVVMSERAIKQAQEEGALFIASGADVGQEASRPVFGGAFFRDGSWVLGMEPMFLQFPEGYTRKGNTYTIDTIDGRSWLFDGKTPVEEVFFAPYPAHFGKKTRRGTPMMKMVSARFPGLLFIYLYNRCCFWADQMQCKYCSFPTRVFKRKPGFSQEDLDDL